MNHPLLKGLRRSLTALAVALVTIAGFLWLSGGLIGELAASRAWIKQPDFTETSRSNEDLFAQAVSTGLIWLDPTGPVIRSQPCEALFDPSLAVPTPQGTKGFSRTLLDRLCTLPAGAQVRSEMLAWNNSFLVAGARDDRAADQRCADGTPLSLPVVPAGCRPPSWTARVAQSTDLAAPLNLLPGAVPPPRDFSDFATRRARQLSDWALFGPLRSPEDRLVLGTRLPAGNRRVTIDMILEPGLIRIGNERANLDPKRDSQTVRLAGMSIAAERVCSDSDAFATCAEEAQSGLPHGWRFTITGQRRREVEIGFEGTPVRAVPPRAREILGSGGAKPEDGKVKLWRSSHIEADCERDKTQLVCELDWRGSVTQRRSGASRGLAFADGSPALDANGIPLPVVDELGLTAMIGYGSGDVGSLSAALGRARTRQDLVLTVEPRLQKLAQEAVYGHMGERLGRGKRPRRPGPLPVNLAPEQEPPDQGDGRAVVVLMDAGDEPGSILALASWPDFVPGMHSWDIQALSTGRDSDSPLAGHGWRAGDVHTMPGSTFKLVTGLAGILASEEMPRLNDIILGRTPPAQQAQMFGIPGGGGLNVDGVQITNYGGAGFNVGILSPAQTGCPDGGRGAQIGFCEALIKSSNLWFAGVALVMDGRKVGGRPTTVAERTGTTLARLTEHLYPITQPGKAVQPGIDLTRGIVPGAQRLTGEALDLAVEDKRNARRIDLVTNSYGQGVRATPVAMASIYGSLGARKVIRPRVLKPVDDVAEAPQTGEGEPVIPGMDPRQAEVYLDAAQRGLFGVVNSPGGTAAGVMASLPPEVRRRIFGKTGTADTTDGMNSAWFAGWMNDVAGRKRVAFTCLVSHTRETGGRACGRLMAGLLGKVAALGDRK
ncbi:penicillin-binding transpeptidase domain-containing protein [Bosea sp. TWI1241]|uniref:penicillin-binding transpeptidase domain-containing protein n=1 Tax=Bosea sp. TWI1241 TaxID=3148904 RepID=UPI003208EFE0